MERLSKDLPSDTVLWRYMSLVKFLDLISAKELTLCRMDKFEDPFEGDASQLVRQAISILSDDGFPDITCFQDMLFRSAYNIRQRAYALCLHANNAESAAMWKLYGHYGETIAIKTTVGMLKQSIVMENLFSGCAVYGVSDDEIKKFYNDGKTAHDNVINMNYLEPLFLKRSSFEHEREYRIVFFDKKHLPDIVSVDTCSSDSGLPTIHKINCNIQDMIQEIVIYPEASQWVVSAIENTVRAFGYDFKVSKSDLYTLK